MKKSVEYYVKNLRPNLKRRQNMIYPPFLLCAAKVKIAFVSKKVIRITKIALNFW